MENREIVMEKYFVKFVGTLLHAEVGVIHAYILVCMRIPIHMYSCLNAHMKRISISLAKYKIYFVGAYLHA